MTGIETSAAPAAVASSHRTVAACVGLALTPLLHLALTTTRGSGVATAVASGTLLSVVFCARWCRPRLKRGVALGLGAATWFWALSLTGAWLLGSASSTLTTAVLVGLPATALTALACAREWGQDPEKEALESPVVCAVVILPLVTGICGHQLAREEQVRRAEAQVAAQLESAGVRPWLPEFDGYARTEGGRTYGDDEWDTSTYSLGFAPRRRDPRGPEDPSDLHLYVQVRTANLEGECAGLGEGCEYHDDYAVNRAGHLIGIGTSLETKIETEVIVTRGGSELVATLPLAGDLSEEEVAQALQQARLVDWSTVLRLEVR
ncbi:hypothetical protein JK386_11820 [Nocardioides sp. zg-536]|uniref:Uncharacterized protein n=1 Tax=Nocardioides faecalis TaxID=2803858 RepID=A0A938Y5T3_9ACTN|nr:hypothetical protein [Nocardioides faecalis]MBM9460593.1 hypothetical protein [Nocardioides faecalis]QVI57482.1 hypothetical protein KG111_10250 [Nocardioides faecalis]